MPRPMLFWNIKIAERTIMFDFVLHELARQSEMKTNKNRHQPHPLLSSSPYSPSLRFLNYAIAIQLTHAIHVMAVSSLARIEGRSEFSKKYINYDPSRLRSLL
jgi:hypothetical protein